MTSTERLNKTSERVKDSRKTMLETEELGVSILHDLHSQRQSLLHAHDTVIFLISCLIYDVFVILLEQRFIFCYNNFSMHALCDFHL